MFARVVLIKQLKFGNVDEKKQQQQKKQAKIIKIFIYIFFS